jgi:hypothetical protein
MKKISTVTAKKVEKNASQQLTIGLDLGGVGTAFWMKREKCGNPFGSVASRHGFPVRRPRPMARLKILLSVN